MNEEMNEQKVTGADGVGKTVRDTMTSGYVSLYLDMGGREKRDPTFHLL